MSFSDYTALKSALTGPNGWLHRSNLDARIPEFIALAEARINRLAKVRSMEIEAALTMVPGARFIALPAAFQTPLAAWSDRTQPPLTATTPEVMTVRTDAGEPRAWCVDGDRLAFDCAADTARQITLRYTGGVQLSDDAPTNSVLTKYPDLYLYGVLLAAAPFLRDTANASMWGGLFDAAVREVNRAESRSRSVAPLRTDLPMSCAR